MGLDDDDLKNATIIPAGCVFVIGLAVLTCCCLRCKNQREEIERRRAVKSEKQKQSDNQRLKMDDVNHNRISPNSYSNGTSNFRTFSEIPYEEKSTTQTPLSNPSYEEDEPETIYDGQDDQVYLKHNSPLDPIKRTSEQDSDAGSCSSTSIKDGSKSTSQTPVSM